MADSRPEAEATSSLPPPPITSSTLPHTDQHVALIGLGAIGISFLALHLTYTSATISVYDPRPDLQDHVASILPLYLPTSNNTHETSNPNGTTKISSYVSSGRLNFSNSIEDAVSQATIIQEQGPENLAFKQSTWSEVLQHAQPTAHLWSSTSGIPASRQLSHLSPSSTNLSEQSISSARSRLLVVHPFNPPHLMPLLEIVPSPSTSPEECTFAAEYFTTSSPLHRPIPISKETTGFIANRLSFILFREACSLVNQGACTVSELDEIVRASLGPRWTVGGPFEMYNFGGGGRGLQGFLDNIGGAIGDVWRDVDSIEGISMAAGAKEGGEKTGAGRNEVEGDKAEGEVRDWQQIVVEQTLQAYGVPGSEDVRRRDRGLKEIVRVQQEIDRQRNSQ